MWVHAVHHFTHPTPAAALPLAHATLWYPCQSCEVTMAQTYQCMCSKCSDYSDEMLIHAERHWPQADIFIFTEHDAWQTWFDLICLSPKNLSNLSSYDVHLNRTCIVLHVNQSAKVPFCCHMSCCFIAGIMDPIAKCALDNLKHLNCSGLEMVA